MRTGMVLVLCGAVLLVGGLAGAAQQVESKITSVTVYSDRALVTRVATLQVSPGEYDFVFTGLPRWLDDDSLRASGSGTASARLLGLESKVAYTKETPEERVQKLRDEIQTLEDRMQALTDEVAVLAEQQRFITEMKLAAQQTAAQQFQFKEVNTAEWDTVLKFVGTNLTTLNESAREKQMAQRELKKELEIKKAELGRIKPDRVVQTKQVTVSVEALGEGTLDLALDYVVGNASWGPMYDARANLDKGTVELTYYGTVAQNTGEDWPVVKLALSTAQPAVGAQVPELLPWYLDAGWRRVEEEEKRLAKGLLAPRTERPASPGEAGGEGDGYTGEPMEHAMATVQERGTSAIFQVAKLETIPSDGQPHRTTIGIVKLEGTMRYTIVPKLLETAFLGAEVKNTSELRLLAGAVHVFLGPDFIGEAALKGVAPTEAFDLSLGPDDRVKVKREILKDRTKVSDVRNRVAVRNTISVTVENYTAKSVSIVVKEQVPVSQDADVKVKLVEATDKIVPDEATGELKWAFDLAQGEKKVLTFEFEFSFPKEAFDYYKRALAAEVAF
jgi:uncharacterized protein (TIGR02231 family)